MSSAQPPRPPKPPQLRKWPPPLRPSPAGKPAQEQPAKSPSPAHPARSGKTSTSALRAEHDQILASIRAIATRVESLHEQTTTNQMAMAREVLEFVRKQIAPHARAEEYTVYPAADWAAGEGSKLTELPRYEHLLVARYCESLDEAIQKGATVGRLMHLCYSVLALIAAHFEVTNAVILPYLDEAFDVARFEKEVLTPLRAERAAKR